MIERVTAERGVYSIKMVTFKVGDEEILQPRAAEGAVGREGQLGAGRIVDQHFPVAVSIHTNDLIHWRELSFFRHTGQGNVEVALYIERHAVRYGRKPFGVDLRLAKRPIFFDLDTHAVVA